MRRNYFILQKALAKEEKQSPGSESPHPPCSSRSQVSEEEQNNEKIKSWLMGNENDYISSEGNTSILESASSSPSIIISIKDSSVNEAVGNDEATTLPDPTSPIMLLQRYVTKEVGVDEAIKPPDPPPYSPITPMQKNINEEVGVVEAIQSPDPPPYSPITPMQININEEVGVDDAIQSPDPPPYSPITPMQRNNNEEDTDKRTDLSPLPPMTPETTKLFNTLIDDFDDDDSVKDPDYIENSESSLDDSFEIERPEKITLKAIIHAEPNAGLIKQQSLNHDENLILDNFDLIITENTVGTEIQNENSKEPTNAVLLQNEVNETEPNRNSGRPKRGRKRKFDEYTLADRKMRKYNNLPYHGKKKEVEAKSFNDYKCTCAKHCFLIVDKATRQNEFQKFISLGSYEAQLLYIVSCVKEVPKKRSYKTTTTDKKKTRQYHRIYKISDIQVCRDMFLKTFQITTQRVTISLQKKKSNTISDCRGTKSGGWNKTDQEEIDLICKVIDALPKYESHYRRSQNCDVLYLQPGMTIQKIYDLYLDEQKKCYSRKPVSLQTLSTIFRKKFNLRIKSLKKDTCNKCDSLKARLKSQNLSDIERESLLSEKENHLKTAETLRDQMNKDIERAKSDQKFECITFDMEKTLPLPRIPTNIVFYKRQLWFYNCGVHVGSNDKGYCFVWVEGEAGRGAQEVGSCLLKFFKSNLKTGVEHVNLWSDCCGGQNRNIKMVLLMKAILDSHPTLKTIKLKFLESGHTFLPNDTDFGKIESHLKHFQRLYTANDYINVIETCKKNNPLQVIKMTAEDFVGTKKIEKNIVNRKIFRDKSKVNWLKTKEILIKKEEKGSIFMKAMNEQHKELVIEKKIKGSPLPVTEKELIPLWPQGKQIAQAKLEDLKSMFHLIPEDCLEFYRCLEGDSNLSDDVDGFGVIDFELEKTDDEED